MTAAHASERTMTVLDSAAPDTRHRVAELVRRLLAKRGIERTMGDDDDLAESGLSSLDLVNLMLAVESEFDLKIPERDMRPVNFRSIARIEALVASLMGQGDTVAG
jgi:acyl carrier protein